MSRPFFLLKLGFSLHVDSNLVGIHLVGEMMDAKMRFLQLDLVPQTQVLGSWVSVHQTVTVHCLNLKTKTGQPVSQGCSSLWNASHLSLQTLKSCDHFPATGSIPMRKICAIWVISAQLLQQDTVQSVHLPENYDHFLSLRPRYLGRPCENAVLIETFLTPWSQTHNSQT